jgi:bifunctional non-homologous end joining protein LigD
MGLDVYRKKRRFDKTPEPSGDAKRKPGKDASKLVYAIQKHRATRLHYDLRLEWDGVLLSWAVPKGPSLDPTVKRLAHQTEDHPLDYADFEGIIPEGEYGGGTVMVWDFGSWMPESPDVGAAMKKGDLKFTIHGTKLHGSWVLVRIKSWDKKGGDDNWLMIKHRDEHASTDDVTLSHPWSVLTGRSLRQIATDGGGNVEKAADADPPTGAPAPAAPASRPARARKTGSRRSADAPGGTAPRSASARARAPRRPKPR